MPLSLLSLVLAAFCVGTTEFVIAGLLPSIAGELRVTIPTAGLLVTGYAIGVAVGGPIMGLLMTPLQRKQSMLVIMAIFIAGHVWCAFADDYTLLMVGRIIISMSHGTFFGLAVIVAASVVPPERRGRAVSMIVAGITIANILGVPGGTAIGNALGWRAVFWTLAGLGAVAAVAMFALLPGERTDRAKAPGIGAQFRVLGQHQVYMTFAAVIFMMIGFWCVFTYIAPFLITTSGVPEAYVPGLLLLFGTGATVGALAGGWLADRAPRPVMLWIFPAQAAILGILILASGSAVAMTVMLFVFGVVSFLPNTAMVNRFMGAAAEAPELTSTLMSSVYNVGIASGAYLGAVLLERGVGYAQLPWFGIAALAVGFVIIAVSLGIERPVARAAR